MSGNVQQLSTANFCGNAGSFLPPFSQLSKPLLEKQRQEFINIEALQKLAEKPGHYPSQQHSFTQLSKQDDDIWQPSSTLSATHLPEENAKAKKIKQQYERVVDVSCALLDLPADWDGEGSPQVSKKAWRKATRFVLEAARSFTKPMPVPQISAGPEGSVDVHWRNSQRELLINFPADEKMPPNYYGDNYQNGKIKGTLELDEDNLWLLIWLTRK